MRNLICRAAVLAGAVAVLLGTGTGAAAARPQPHLAVTHSSYHHGKGHHGKYQHGKGARKTGTCKVTASGHRYRSLQTAVNAAAAGATLSVAGTCTGTTTVGKNLTIGGHANATLNGGKAGSVLTIDAGASVTLNTLIITNGSGTEGSGGGIYNFGPVTPKDHSTVSNNTAGSVGGGIYNNDGMLKGAVAGENVYGNRPDNIDNASG